MSLPETAVHTARCPKCDAEVRDGSVFCYNCGGRVVGDDGIDQTIGTPPVAGASASKPAPGLRSARDIRRRERISDRKPREVVWEAVNGGPDLQLIIATASIIVFTVLVILLVRYLG